MVDPLIGSRSFEGKRWTYDVIDHLTRKAFRVFDWISKMAVVNILWIVFTGLGLVVLGLAPATVASFTVIRKWLMKHEDFPVLRTFTHVYKQEFMKSNLLGLFTLALGFFLFLDLKLVLTIEGIFQYLIGVPLILAIFCYLLIILYIIPVYVSFEWTFFQYFKYSLYIGLLNLPVTIYILMLSFLVAMLMIFLPGFIPFFSGSVIFLITMFGAKLAFERIENKQMKYHSSEGNG